jgi:hypothetical protein
MKRLCLPLVALATPLAAADRSIVVTDFDRIRVEGPFELHVATHGTPAARITGSRAAADRVDLRVEGTTLIVRAVGQASAGPSGASASDAPVITLRTLNLQTVTVIGGGTVDVVGPMHATRVDLQISGSGAITAGGIDADQLNVALIGAATATLGGRAARARLFSNGASTIEATPLHVDALVLRLDGTGTTHASARYSADVVTTGLGGATVYGKPKCTVKARGGPIDCGAAPPVK